jgi:hypothetical protein
MYKCERCKQFTKPGEKMEKIVTETRNKIYMRKNKRGYDVEAGRGWEIVKESNWGTECYNTH